MTGPSPTLWRLLTVTPTRRLFEWLTRDHAIVFMLHRFRDERSGVQGHDPVAVDRALTELRKRGFAFLELEEMVEELIHRASRGSSGLSRTVAFTMDDGYEDQLRVGDALFRAHRCPVTTFLITAFLDGDRWMWWDQIQHIVERSSTDLSRYSLAGPGDAGIPRNGTDAAGIIRRLMAECHGLVPEARPPALRALAAHARVELPERPPDRFAAATWEDVRTLEGDWMRFAPHTVTHPPLDAVSEDVSRREIVESWERLRTTLAHPVPVFAYPYGRFGTREEELVRDAGLLGAVSDRSGVNHPRHIRRDPQARFRIRRVGLPNDPVRSFLYASGLANVADLVRAGSPLNGST